MADQKLTDLTELAEAPALTDLSEVVDVSDSTHDASGTSKKLTFQNLLNAISRLTAKTTLVDADTFPLTDSEASDAAKKVTGTNLKAYLKTYFDTLYAAASHTHTASEITDFDTEVANNSAVTANTAKVGVTTEEANPDVVSQAEAEAGTATTERIWTAQRVAQAIAALASGGSSDHGGLTGLTDDDHTQYAIISSGAGAPSSTPSRVGAIYVDTTNDEVYIATDTTGSGDWDLATASAGGGITSLEGQTGATQTFADDTNVTIVSASDTHTVTWAGQLAIARGGTGASTASAARTNLGVDAAGTDNSTDVTLGGSPDYITIAGQVITRALINLASHVTGVLPIANGGTGGATASAARTALDVDQAGTDNAPAASESTAGKIEVATSTEINTGTDTAKAMSPDQYAASDRGKRVVGLMVFSDADDVATGDGAGDIFFRIPAVLNGMDLVDIEVAVQTAGTTGTTDVQIHNVTQTADMLSTKATIDSAETDTSSAATAPVIDTANDDVATGDIIRVDVDAVSTTAPKGLYVELTFQTP